MGDKAQFAAEIDLSQVTKGIAEVHSRQEAALGPGSRFSENLERLDGFGKKAEKGLRGAQFAIGGLGAEASETVGIIGTFADLLAGPATAGVALLGLAVTEAYGEWKAYKQAQQDAHDALDHLGEDLEKRFLKQMQDMTGSVKDLRTELANFGKDAQQVSIDTLVGQLAAAEGRLPRLREAAAKHAEDMAKLQARADEFAEAGLRNPEQDRLDTLSAVIELDNQRLDQLQATIGATRDTLDETTRLTLELDAKQTEADNKRAAKLTAQKTEADAIAAILAEPDVGENAFGLAITDPEAFARQQAEARAKAQDVFAAASDKNRDIEFAKEQAYEQKRALGHRAALEQMLRDERAYFAKIDGYYTSFEEDTIKGVTSSGINAVGTFFGALASGHKDAAKEAEAAFLSSVGSQLVGIGTRASFEGAEILLASHGLDPAGYGLLGLGAAAVAAGIGMGAGGAALARPDTSASGSGSPSRATTERGFSGRGGGGGGGGGGPTVINITYGAAGPAPQDTGRAVYDALRAHGAATGLTIPNTPQGPRR